MTKQKVLIIDTSSENISLMLCSSGKVVGRWEQKGEPDAGRQVLVGVEELLEENNLTLPDIDRIAVHRGPGVRSSALRSGIVVAAVLGLASSIEVVEVEGEGDIVKKAFEAKAKDVIEANYERPGYGV